VPLFRTIQDAWNWWTTPQETYSDAFARAEKAKAEFYAKKEIADAYKAIDSAKAELAIEKAKLSLYANPVELKTGEPFSLTLKFDGPTKAHSAASAVVSTGPVSAFPDWPAWPNWLEWPNAVAGSGPAQKAATKPQETPDAEQAVEPAEKRALALDGL
jgi:hypothetical protein